MMNWTHFFRVAAVLICCAIGTDAIGARAIAELEYYYAKDGTIIGRRVNDNHQAFQYDKRGQLISVVDVKTMKPLEQYAYDPAGNILSKTINGQTTTFIYDKANQLLSSTVDGKTTSYQYDGAGRLIKEGDKTYRYSYLDKLVEVMENGEQTASFDYHINGQIASVRRTAKLPAQASGAGEEVENFLWDGLALIHRGNTNYINEPYVTGGNPILADDKVLFNDMLGTTLGVKSGDQFSSITRDAFGQTADQSKDQFFTGKPYIGELGYAFLLRNYRAEKGKWQTQDPLGYIDGWNNFAYCKNNTTYAIDLYGAYTTTGELWVERFVVDYSIGQPICSYDSNIGCYLVTIDWWAVFGEKWDGQTYHCDCDCATHCREACDPYVLEAGSDIGVAVANAVQPYVMTIVVPAELSEAEYQSQMPIWVTTALIDVYNYIFGFEGMRKKDIEIYFPCKPE